MKKAIVISAVNLRKGGTLTILRDCLSFLSESKYPEQYRIIALVHDKKLAFYKNIEYVEFPNTIKSWGRRLWCEYVTMYFLSKKISHVYLWLSLHDTTPNVVSEKRAVYCQTSFPFMKPKWSDLLFDYKIVLFSFFTRFAYRINIMKNDYIVVQTEWMKKNMAGMFGLLEDRFIVAPPEQKSYVIHASNSKKENCFIFFFPSTPDCHKNFEVLCKAAELLEMEIGKGKFKVVITINGRENRYSRWLYNKWKNVDSIDFKGFLSKYDVYTYYSIADCLVFPSRIETWGLPISEFSFFKKPLILADLPYAHETAQGIDNVCFFNPYESLELKNIMKKIIFEDYEQFNLIPKIQRKGLYVNTWKDLFEKLVNN